MCKVFAAKSNHTYNGYAIMRCTPETHFRSIMFLYHTECFQNVRSYPLVFHYCLPAKRLVFLLASFRVYGV